MAIKLQFPFRALVSGVSGSGKSTFVAKLIANRDWMITPKVERVVYCAKYRSSVPKSIINDVEFCEGLPTQEYFDNVSNLRTIIILDDLQEEAFSSPIVVGAFQRARHTNCGLIILSQNLFPRNRRTRDVSLNCNLIVIFFNARDSSSILPLSRQLNPLQPLKLARIFFTYINSAYKYILCDLSATTDELLRYRTNIFDPKKCEVFVTEKDLSKLKNLNINGGTTQAQSPFTFELLEA